MTSQLSSSREDKDLYAGDLASGSDGRSSPRLPTTYTSSSTQSGSRRQRRRLGRFIHSIPLVPRLIRYSRVVLGPSTPIPDNQLPIPQASLSLSLTLSSFSRSTPIDPKIRNWSQRWKLHYGLYPFLALWAMAFVLLIREQYYRPSPDIIACNASVWSDWPPDSCGLNGRDCVDALVSGQYRCMGRCLDVTLGNPRWVGGEEVNDVPLVIGGSQDHTYRADSWVCPSAIHAGLISASLGGCVDLRALDYPAGVSGLIGSSSNGVQSLSFAPQFYGAFALSSLSSSGCMDLHPIITSVNAVCLLITTVLLSPRPGVLFTILLLLGYVQILLLSNPPSQPPNWDTVLGRLPPTLAAGYWMWRVSFKRTLEAFTHLPLETALWQGAGFWIGVESSTIFASLPIDRLGYGELSASGVIALVVIIVVVLLLVLVQAWQARKFGMLQYYLVRYIWLAPILLVLAFIPDYTLRLHHYLYALAAIPELSLPNRVSLFGQAFALGLFLDGTGRWGWDSILEYTASLLGDAFAGTGTPLFLKDNSTASIISWLPLAGFDLDSGYQGVAMVVDDVLRVVNATSSSYPISTLGLDPSIDHFFRLAFSVNGSTQDYTDPIVLYANGTWDER